MNEEQKARLAEIAREYAGWSRASEAAGDTVEWLLALVKELDEENARLRGDRPIFENAPGHSFDMSGEIPRVTCPLEQQLATVTAALKAAGVDGLGPLSEQIARLAADRDGYHASAQRVRDDLNHEAWRLEDERDELKREVERFKEQLEGCPTCDDFIERAEKAEAERDVLRAVVDAARCMTIDTYERVRELARLKGEKGIG